MLLNTRTAQTRNTIGNERPFPGKELFLGELVDVANLVDRDSAAAYRDDHGGLPTDYPPLCVRVWQTFFERRLAR
jgi:hypothetical protein